MEAEGTTMKTAIGLITPNRYFAPWEFVSSILSLKREHIICMRSSARLDENRNMILAQAKELGAEALLMIDTDMVFTNEDVEKIFAHIESGKDYVSGVFHAGHHPHTLCVYGGYDEVNKKHIPAELGHEVFKIHASGLAFVAISKKLMHTLPPFAFNREYLNNILLGGDLAFGKMVRELGFELWCDPTINIGHVVSKVV
jgi:hypothetical protein